MSKIKICIRQTTKWIGEKKKVDFNNSVILPPPVTPFSNRVKLGAISKLSHLCFS